MPDITLPSAALLGALRAAAPSPGSASPDAELITLCADFCRLEREWLARLEANTDDADSRLEDFRRERQSEIVEFIVDNPPQTSEGFRAVAFAAALWAPELWDKVLGQNKRFAIKESGGA